MLSDKIVEAFEAYKMEFKEEMGRKKSLRRSTVNCLYSCLEHKAYPHVLKWTENEREFSILFRRKGSSNWNISDLDFFKKMDSLSPSKKEKYFNQPDYDLGCKRRCKANLRKLCKDNILKFIGKKEIDNDKSTKLKFYKFLEIPKEAEKIRCRPFAEENNNKSLFNEEFEANFINSNSEMQLSNVKENYFIDTNASNTYELPEMELSNEYFMNSNVLDTFEYPKMKITDVKEFLQIKASLPGYNELRKSSLTQLMPLWSDCSMPQIKNGMNINEVVDIL